VRFLCIAFPQVIACSNLVGDWEDYFSLDQYYLSQDAKGNLSGWMTTGPCNLPTDWPITGTISSGQFTFTATNKGCSLSSASWVTFAGTVSAPGCNFVSGTYTNSNGGSGGWGDSNPYPTLLDYVTKAVDVPASESTVVPTGAQWNTSHGAPSNQTFAPNSPAGEFEGRGVYEYAGTGPGNDTCWFPKSKFPIYDAISTPGFAWTVSSKNTWGADFIGWTLAAVQYYRSQKRVPCGSSFLQKTVIDAAYSPNNPSGYGGPYTSQYGQNFYGVAYETNTLGANITATTVTSSRDGKTSTNTTWK
jgi:hypothetical protein